MNDLEKAKEKLLTGDYTCVLCRENEMLTTTLRGVKPLVAWYETANNFENFSAADRVVGKATAFLYALLGVKAVFARVLSKPALQVLNDHNIKVEYEQLVKSIINRKGDGICPFELAVLNIDNPSDAYKSIRDKMKELGIVI